MATETPIAVIERQKKRGGTKGWGVSIEADELTILPSPVVLVDMLSRAVMAHTSAAILEGVRSDTGARQPDLEEGGRSGREAASGRRPDERGVTTKAYFPNKLRRTKLRVSRKLVRFGKGARKGGGHIGVQAACNIEPPPIGNWLDRELERGVEYFHTGGDVDRIVEEVLKAFVEGVTGGPVDVQADDLLAEQLPARQRNARSVTLVRPWNS